MQIFAFNKEFSLCFWIVILTVFLFAYSCILPPTYIYANEMPSQQILIEDNYKTFGDKIFNVTISPANERLILLSSKENIFAFDLSQNKFKKIPYIGHNILNIIFSNNGKFVGIRDVGSFGFYDVDKKVLNSYSELLFAWNTPEFVCFSENSSFFIAMGYLHNIGYVSVVTNVDNRKITIIPFGFEGCTDTFVTEAIQNYCPYISRDIDIFRAFFGRELIVFDCNKSRIVKKLSFPNLNRNDLPKWQKSDKRMFLFHFVSSNIAISSFKNMIFKIFIDNPTKYEYYEFPNSLYFNGSLKTNKSGMAIIEGKEKNKQICFIFDTAKMKPLSDRIIIDRNSFSRRNYDIAPSGKFIVYVRDGKLYKRDLPPVE